MKKHFFRTLAVITTAVFTTITSAALFTSCSDDTPGGGSTKVKKATGITVTPADVSLKAGRTQQLTAIVEPADADDKTYKWTSVPSGWVNDAGLVTVPEDAIAGNTATITATANDGGGANGSCTVTVLAADAKMVIIGAQGTTPTEGTAGEAAFAITTENIADGATGSLSWFSDAAGTVAGTKPSGFEVPAFSVSSGHATLTITTDAAAAAGKYYFKVTIDGTTSSVSTFVINAASTGFTAVTDITGVPTEATAGTPVTLTGTVVPGNANNRTIVWSITDAETTGATITDGNTLNTTAAGNVTVRATIVNGASPTSDYTKDFTIAVNPPAVPAPGRVVYTGYLTANNHSLLTWDNGTVTTLPVPGNATMSYVTGIAVDGNDVFVSGYYYTTSGTYDDYIPCYWKNGVRTDLPRHTDRRHTRTTGIFVKEGVPYVSGYGYNYNAATWYHIACYWRGTSRTDIGTANAYSSANCITVSSDGYVYTGGHQSYVGCYWRGSSKTDLSGDAVIDAIAMDGSDVYTLDAGTGYMLFKNKTRLTLADATDYFGDPIDIRSVAAADGSYCVAGSSSGRAYIWKNGARIAADILSTDFWDIAISSTGKVYCAGVTYNYGSPTDAVYWVDGTKVTIAPVSDEHTLEYCCIVL